MGLRPGRLIAGIALLCLDAPVLVFLIGNQFISNSHENTETAPLLVSILLKIAVFAVGIGLLVTGVQLIRSARRG